MRFLSALLAMVLFCFAAGYVLPWWSIAIVCFVVAMGFKLRNAPAFFSGFLSVFILWLLIALLKDHANEQLLSARMAALFKLNNSYLFIAVGAFVGGLVGGLAGWSGGLVRHAMNNKQDHQ
ncbi:MAG TPA: hypothetical protein VL098_00505 [Flavipsychrobacter sp.]|nr:hypothetical protein [Flavipsychrobacter sp.]